jgi:peroxiredoxin
MRKLALILIGALLQTVILSAGEPYKAGDVVSDISLKNLDGKMVSFSQFKDAKGFIVVFSCNTCPVVKKYEDRIIGLNNQFSDKGYPVVAINSNDKTVSPGDSFEDMKKYAKSTGLKFEYLYDESQEVAKRWGATNTPHVYVLTKDGDKLKVAYVGAIDNNADDSGSADKKYAADAVNALLNNEKVPVASTKAVGCGIKWKKS